MSEPVALTLLTKPGCHLCDDARAVVVEVSHTARQRGMDVSLTERNILEDEALARVHSEDIPVVFIGERRHAIWRVDAEKLAVAIERAAGVGIEGSAGESLSASPAGLFRKLFGR